MAIYFGGKDEQSPIAAKSTASWDTVNPPEVQAAAWAWEKERRAAEEARQLQERLDEAGKAADDIAKAEALAVQFQGVRGYKQAIDSGIPAKDAMAKYGPMMFFTKPSAIPNQQPDYKIRNIGGVGYRDDGSGNLTPVTSIPQAKVETLTENGVNIRRITNPSGNMTERVLQPIKDPDERDFRAREQKALLALDEASRDFLKFGATREEITPASSGMFSSTPARTNTVPAIPGSALKFEEARAAKKAAEDQLKAIRAERQAKPAPTATPAAKVLTKEILKAYYEKAGRNRDEALRMAKEDGYTY